MHFKAESLQKFEIWGSLGELISDLLGINRCKKSEWLKTGLRVAAGKFETGGCGSLKREQTSKTSETATQRTKHGLRA